MKLFELKMCQTQFQKTKIINVSDSFSTVFQKEMSDTILIGLENVSDTFFVNKSKNVSA